MPSSQPTLQPSEIASMAPGQLRVPDPTRPSVLSALRLRASAALLPRMLAYFPGNTAMRTDYADVLWLLKRHAQAIQQYDMSLKLDARQTHALLRCGVAHMSLGQPELALPRFNEALKQAPQHPEPHFRKSTALGRLGRQDEALRSILRALQLDAQDARLHNQHGVILLALGQVLEASVAFDRALALAPGMGKALCNRGMLLLGQTRYDAARQALEAAVAAEPDLAAAHANLGLTLMWLRQDVAARAAMARAQALSPKPDPLVCWNQGCLHLLQGDWRAGWPLIESRWDGVLRGALPKADQPLWQGEMPIAGRTILIHPEQGLGDFIQFARYAPLLAQAGAKVILHTPPELVRLMHSLPGEVHVVPQHSPVPAFDLRVPVMSLPGALGTTPDAVPYGRGYLSVPEGEASRWAQRMGPRRGLRVGLVWSGGFRPDQPALSGLNQRRNIPLHLLAPLAGVEGVTFYSLQKGKEAEAEWHALREARWAGPHMVGLMDEVKDFADTAALISQLDLVIAVDTSTAHAAAALGKPVWLLNRHDTCWRWMFDRVDTPWYASMRLFRQREPGQWGPVVADVTQALQAWAQTQCAPAPAKRDDKVARDAALPA